MISINKLKDKLRIYYIYVIYHNYIPIYVGSTYDLENRQLDHNKNIRKRIKENKENGINLKYNLYDYCDFHNINEVELVVRKSGMDDIMIVDNGFFEYKRFIEEKAIIDLFIQNKIKLTNIVYPTYHNKSKYIDYTNCKNELYPLTDKEKLILTNTDNCLF